MKAELSIPGLVFEALELLGVKVAPLGVEVMSPKLPQPLRAPLVLEPLKHDIISPAIH